MTAYYFSRYVKALTDSEGKVVKEYEPVTVRKVLSAKTAKEMRGIMQYVVDEGGAATRESRATASANRYGEQD